jgi:hypothetical protein
LLVGVDFTSEARSKAVFLLDEPSIYQLKGCTLFWKTIVVYPSFIQSLVQYQEPTEIVKALLERGILKIASTPEELKNGLYDKVYYGLDKGLHGFMYENPGKVTIPPQLPQDAETIINESTKLDYNNKELKQLIDSIVYKKTLDDWIMGARESRYFAQAPPEIAAEVSKTIKTLADKQFEHYITRSENSRFHFEYRNKEMLEQFSVSSAICIDSDWVPLYRYKLGDFEVKNAETYLSGLDVVVPLIAKISVHDLTMEEILRLRKNKSWNNAMNQFGDLCYAATTSEDEDFKEKITAAVLENCLEAYKEERISLRELGANESKKALYTGISFIPIVGPAVSMAAGFVDPLVKFLYKRNKQKNLPSFLNDMRNIRD